METKKEIYIIISVSLLLSVLLILFFVYPLFKGIKRDSQQIMARKNSVLLLKSEFLEAEKFQKRYETLKPDLDKLDQMFVDSKNPVDFIEFLEKIASDSGTKVEITTPSFSQEGPLTFASLQLSCSGDYSKVLKFINALETGNYLLQIKNLDITRTRASLLIKVFAK